MRHDGHEGKAPVNGDWWIMELDQLNELVLLRAIVGFLGERERNPWWPSSFFGTGSKSFLAPVFPRTHVLAQYQGVMQAASIVHDERIGVGNVFHLFRLPEDLEYSIQGSIQQLSMASAIAEWTARADYALTVIDKISGGQTPKNVGPVRVGSLADLRDAAVWRQVAAHYVAGFRQGFEVYPYFVNQ